MKRIIGYTIYDTDQAIVVVTHKNRGWASYGSTGGEFDHETLHRASNGSSFLMYRRARLFGGWRNLAIMPINNGGALSWLKKYQEIALINQYFPNHLRDA